jgi:hypothetical protein
LVAGQETAWVPAFPSQRPPFAPGNEVAATYHGAYSPRRVDPLAAELVAVVLDDPQASHAFTPPLQAPLARRPLAGRDLLLGDRCRPIPPPPGVRRGITYPLSGANALVSAGLANGSLSGCCCIMTGTVAARLVVM